ncbi:MAG: hypothetical protein LC650_02345 [Actinobacteria bacterium]|nr:hypothetical protein [Actinomycetota bacterium]
MSAETAVVIGFATVFFGLAWISFKLNDSPSDVMKYVGVMFLSLSIAVLQIVGWATLQIAEQDPTMTNIVAGVTVPLLWILNIALFLFWVVLLLRSLVYLAITIMQTLGKLFGGEV